ncbi:MAG: hypothetical protein AAGI11_15180 [Pseudomonadota bacterium]
MTEDTTTDADQLPDLDESVATLAKAMEGYSNAAGDYEAAWDDLYSAIMAVIKASGVPSELL